MPKFPASIDRGFQTDPWPSECQLVYSSSEEDFEREKRSMELQLDDIAGAWRLFSPSAERRAQIGEELTDIERRTLENFAMQEKLFRSRLDLLNGITNVDRRLGKIAHYAGFRVRNGFRLDWALVEVTQQRIGLNRVSLKVLRFSPPELTNNSFQCQRTFPWTSS